MKSERPLSVSRTTPPSQRPGRLGVAARDFSSARDLAEREGWLEQWLEAEEDDVHNRPCTD
ncbi:MAG: hypothetical protein IPG50_08565 [Myxococcales bacterium]|nr:hypothetical protein [Myxococcales bacterium]